MAERENGEPVILVTGGAGYIGSQLIRDLHADPRFAHATIRIYDNLRRRRFRGLMDLPADGCYEFIEGDILDRGNLARAMRGVTAVMHLAAIVTTPMHFDQPEWTRQVNQWGTASVIDCALDAGVTRLVYSSSASVYGAGGPFRETDPCRPIGPYSISKRKGEEEVIRSQERGLRATILRLGMTFGTAPAMRHDSVVSQFVYAAGVGRALAIHGTGEQVRPLIHVRDASAALRLCLADASTEGQVYNVATMNHSVNDIAETLRAMAPNVAVRYTDQDVLTNVSYEVDSSRFLSLGFQPAFRLTDGLREMLAHWTGFRPALTGTGPLLAPEDLI
ncbi:MAG: NAD-dependent epimerase/dehydratase family protein [Anaerolineae bacterium]|nr:NAD-dependent epimerase/dehydratase family protein [Anaerolineae bacterium]